jgi:hypothetical protein
MTTYMARTDHASRLRDSLYAHAVDADTRLNFLRLAQAQAALSFDQLNELQSELFGPEGLFADFSAQVAREGRKASVFEDIVQITLKRRLSEVQGAVDFALSRHQERVTPINPFRQHGREALCCMVYDESGINTLVERYVAYEAIRQMDSDFFIKLIATTRGVVERRIVFTGLLEHFDRLLPVEQSIYPVNYRQVQQGHLAREETMYGPLQLTKPLSVVFQDLSPTQLLEQVLNKPGAVD